MRGDVGILVGCILMATVALAMIGADKSATYTDPAKAGIDFALQGEYAGPVTVEGVEQPFGAHVIALGDGAFRLVGYTGGLPGEGWKRGGERRIAEGRLDGDAAVFLVDEATITARGGTLTVQAEGGKLGELKKIERKSPTLGAKPPKEALVLFDGRSVDAFENGKLVEGKYLGATNCYSKKKFGDHSLHVEFRTPFMPAARGQARGNSGVYVQSRYEVQVLDSFGLEGEDNECGGIYSASRPAVNMCYPPLAWQTYDLDFTAPRYDESGKKTRNARITVRHNGVLIHDDLELPAATPGRFGEGPEREALFLQDHGNPVVFRNIWVVEK
jgi:hypothetical protein